MSSERKTLGEVLLWPLLVTIVGGAIVILFERTNFFKTGITLLENTATPIPTLLLPCEVPNVIGLEQSAAEASLINLGLQPVRSNQYDNSATGTVIYQNPQSQTRVDPCQGDVMIIVSLGTPMPSSTPTISPTPMPPTLTPTPIPPDTLPGTVLFANDVWTQENITLRVDRYEFYHHWQISDWAGTHEQVMALLIRFSLENNTGQDIVLNFDRSNFLAQDDAGTQYAIEYLLLGTENENIDEYNETFRNGQQLLITIGFGNNATINSQATNMFVFITQLSRVVGAKWSIEIPR